MLALHVYEVAIHTLCALVTSLFTFDFIEINFLHVTIFSNKQNRKYGNIYFSLWPVILSF